MDTKKLDVLLKVVRIGSLKRAAEELNYTQSGLLYMMNTLEEELGIHLLKRTPKGVFFSNEGKALEPYIRQMVEDDNILSAEIEKISKGNGQHLRIAAYPIYARYWLPDVIKNYVRDYPKDAINIYVGTAEDINAWLETDVVDIAIGEDKRAAGWEWTCLMEDEVYAAVPVSFQIKLRDGRLDLDSIGEFPVLYSGYDPVSSGVREKYADNELNTIEVTSKDGSALLSLVENQLGIAFLSGIYQYECPISVRMYPLDPPVYRKLGIIQRNSKYKSQTIKHFIPYLKKNLPANLTAAEEKPKEP